VHLPFLASRYKGLVHAKLGSPVLESLLEQRSCDREALAGVELEAMDSAAEPGQEPSLPRGDLEHEPGAPGDLRRLRIANEPRLQGQFTL